MRLEKIKLSGFKSFVDPTTVVFPGNRIGIVGPNGCGKSNVIDAVRWVMGESSAKYLRGEAIADVIFNGSTARKPAGKALIEMVFDNSAGKVGGQYANYSEISVRRELERDGQSDYYLNGARCRRRDIMDVFLGTGLSPRSYAIIEQGMINRVIESKPQELRVNFEEVAGIAKYKERRRETENRIKHTRENLSRINDLLDEQGKQIDRLRRQSRSAERYKTLKAEEQVYKGQHLAIRWQQLDDEIQKGDRLLNEGEVLLESKLADQQSIDTDLVNLREQQHDTVQQLTDAQSKVYQAGTEITRLEQRVQHEKSRQETLNTDINQVKQALTDTSQRIVNDKNQLDNLRQALAQLTPQLEQTRQLDQQAQQARIAAEQDTHRWQEIWDDFNHCSSQTSKTVEIEQTRISHLEQQHQHASERLQQIDLEQRAVDYQQLEQAHQVLTEQIQAAELRLQEEEDTLQDLQQQQQQQRQRSQQARDQLAQQRETLQTLRGRLASLETLQQSALGKSEKQMNWLKQWRLADKLRLAQCLEIQEGWELAVEVVLGQLLEAICIEGNEPLQDIINGFDSGRLMLLVAGKPQQPSAMDGERLLDKIKSFVPEIQPLLAHVYVANSFDQAMQLRQRLQAHESVVCQDGTYFGKHWLCVFKPGDNKVGILQREHEIRQLESATTECATSLQATEAQLHESEQALAKIETEMTVARNSVNDANHELADARAKWKVHGEQLQTVKQRAQKLTEEMATLTQHNDTVAGDLATAKQNWQQATMAMEQDIKERESLLDQREQYRQKFSDARTAAQQYREELHRLDVRYQTLQSQLEAGQAALLRTEQQYATLEQQRQRLETKLAEDITPIAAIQEKLEQWLSQRVECETVLKAIQQENSQVEHRIQQQEENRKEAEQAVQEVRSALESERLQLQERKVRRSTLQESLNESGHQLQAILAALDETLTIETLEQSLQKIANSIARLGPINLAAIDELETETERHNHLDRQRLDLEEGLQTLENAIRKIDQDTRRRFKETFDQVNDEFQRLFPKIFGGGRAYLELTDSNLLETGVVVMAQPPGKKNSSIHLLSGGEKALTAIALVFSIFQLNPAPFCMLDEVDAPLDDANVLRYSNLVKEMSDKVQFIFVTHNKITMEIADQLTGVTMNEPGVSRIVAVDIGKALEMAAA
ncbi:MAG: chromosome segregation protein SMC [Pseudomonadota bacterium]